MAPEVRAHAEQIDDRSDHHQEQETARRVGAARQALRQFKARSGRPRQTGEGCGRGVGRDRRGSHVCADVAGRRLLPEVMTLSRDRAPGVGLAVDHDFELGAGRVLPHCGFALSSTLELAGRGMSSNSSKVLPRPTVKINLHRFSLAVSPNRNDPVDCGVHADWLDENAITNLHMSLHATASLRGCRSSRLKRFLYVWAAPT